MTNRRKGMDAGRGERNPRLGMTRRDALFSERQELSWARINLHATQSGRVLLCPLSLPSSFKTVK